MHTNLPTCHIYTNCGNLRHCLVAKFFRTTKTSSIRSSKHRLITKLITLMDVNREMNPLNLINTSLKIIYCSMTMSNHSIIKFVRFIPRFDSGVMK
jgi:hypothetical protein